MKAVMLCAGRGTRLRPLTYSLVKHLIPIANQPVVHFGLENIAAVGIREVGLIVSPESRTVIEEAIGDGSRWGMRTHYIEQSAPLGLAHACQCAETFVDGDSFIMYLGDNLIPEGLAEPVERFRRGADAVVMLKEVDDPRAFGIAVLDGDRVVRLVEKPKDPPSNLAIVGGYVFSPEIFTSIRRIRPSWRNELEITDAIQDLIDRGLRVRSYVMGSYWKDTGSPQDILEANRVMLERLTPDSQGNVDTASRIEGTVVIGVGAEIRNSTVIGPTIIGDGARIEGSVIGPHASVGDRARIRNSRIDNCVLMEDTEVIDLDRRLTESLVGRKVRVSGGDAGTVRLILGDASEVTIGG